MTAPEPLLAVDRLEVRYGTVARRPRTLARGRPRRDRRPDRAERRGQVDDAARGHGCRPVCRRRDPPGRQVAARAPTRAGRAPRRRARAGGPADLPGLHGRGEPAARARRAARERRGGGVRVRLRRSSPCSRSGGARPRAHSPAASSSSSRSVARSSPSPSCCSSTSRRSASRRRSSTSCSTSLAGIRERGVTILLVEQRAQRTVAFADRTYVLASGALRETLGPGDADATDRLVAAYLA